MLSILLIFGIFTLDINDILTLNLAGLVFIDVLAKKKQIRYQVCLCFELAVRNQKSFFLHRVVSFFVCVLCTTGVARKTADAYHSRAPVPTPFCKGLS